MSGIPWWVWLIGIIVAGAVGPLIAYYGARRNSADQGKVDRMELLLNGLEKLVGGYERRAKNLEEELEKERIDCARRIALLEGELKGVKAKVDAVVVEEANG